LVVNNFGYFDSYKNSICSADCSFQSLAAKASCIAFPIFLILAAVFALMDNCCLAQAEIRQEVYPITVELQKARQYDMPGERPSACTFHAIEAMNSIANDFDRVVKMIAQNDQKKLSQYQRGIIQKGLDNYTNALLQASSLIEGADLNDVRPFIPKGLEMGPSQSVIICSSNPGLDQIADHLFSGGSKVVWVKNNNSESFALIAKGNQVVLFDSHRNEILLLSSKEQVVKAILAKSMGNESINVCDYGLGEFLSTFPAR
jgi:hypothetical protein